MPSGARTSSCLVILYDELSQLRQRGYDPAAIYEIEWRAQGRCLI